MSRTKLSDITDEFAALDDEMRLELLLDYANRLPALPEELKEQRDAGMNRVPECMSPVFLWMTRDNVSMRIHVDVGDEAPTVKGILSIITAVYDNAPPADVQTIPDDLLTRLHLDSQIRMNRAVGLSAIITRIKRNAAELASEDGPVPSTNGASSP